MALGVRLKKSLNGGSKSFGKQKSRKFDSNDSDSYRKHRRNEGRKSLLTEKKFSRKDRESDFKTFGRRPINGRRDFVRDDSKNDDSYREHCERGERRNSFTDKSFARGGRDSDVRKFGRRPVYGNQRDFPNDDSVEGTRSLKGTSELRGPRGNRDGRRGEKIPLRSEVIDQLRSRGKNMGRKRKDINGNDSEGRASRSPVRPMRGDRRSYDRKEEIDESVDSVEASSDKLRLKWKKMDKNMKDTDGDDSHQGKGKKLVKGGDNEECLEKSTKSEDGNDQVVEQKPVRCQVRVLDKSGKKIRVGKTRSDDDYAEKGAPEKKKKRVIKIDPYDISNKRLDDSAPLEDKSAEKDSEISKNAQFRAIQPSPSILSFVEDNLLGRRRLNELKDAGYNVKLSAPLDNIPFSTSTERERIEENVFRNKLEFFAAAKVSSSFPPPVIPEIAFAGRSNVGKSSLLNALTRQWGVVRTSDKPGLTQTINFFSLASKLCLVDLPGYGFSYAKEEVKDAWEELVKEYVSARVGLQRVCLLIDTKWGMKPRDYELIDLMERSRTPYQIALTKTDLVFPIDTARRAMQIQENLKKNKSIINPLVMVSSKNGAGVRNLRSVLAKITRFVKP